MLNIVFGSVKATGASRVAEQQFDHSVVTVEALGESGTSRRVLFNRPACKEMDLDDGAAQNILFGFAQPEGESGARLFVVNTAEFTHDVEQKTYNTSKNKASYAGESKEKGKAISNKPLCQEIADFMGLDSAVDQHFVVSVFAEPGEEGGAVVYELTPMGTEIASPATVVEDEQPAPIEEVVADTPAPVATEGADVDFEEEAFLNEGGEVDAAATIAAEDAAEEEGAGEGTWN